MSSQQVKGSVESFLKRAFVFLEDGEWQRADNFFEKVLDIEPENAQAYLGKLMVALEVTKKEELQECIDPFDAFQDYKRAIQFGDETLREELMGYIEIINERNETVKICEENIRKIADAEEKAKDDSKVRNKKFFLFWFPVIVVIVTVFVVLAIFCTKISKYNDAIKLVEEGNYGEAMAIFAELEDFKDSEEQLTFAKYNEAVRLSDSGEYFEAMKLFQELGDYKDCKLKSRYNEAAGYGASGEFHKAAEIFKELGDYSDSKICMLDFLRKKSSRKVVSGGYDHIAGIKSDGTVIADGKNENGQCDVSEWKDIVAIAAGKDYTIGIRSDGTVVATDDYWGVESISMLENIVAVAPGRDYIVALNSKGRVEVYGKKSIVDPTVFDWKDIVAVDTGYSLITKTKPDGSNDVDYTYHTVGLKSDGTVVASGDNVYGQCDVSDWTDIVAVATSGQHTVGLKSDGTVVAVGDNEHGKCNVSEWNDIVAIDTQGDIGTIGLKSDGTVVATFSVSNRDVSGWKDIVAIAEGPSGIIGVKSDGTIVYTGNGYYGEMDVITWENIRTP